MDESLDFSDTEDIVDEAEDTLTILSKYVDGIDTNVDKVKLMSVLKELYTESLELI